MRQLKKMMVETGAFQETKTIEGNTSMNRSVWDDDKCRIVWSHLVVDEPYDWKLLKKGNIPTKSAVQLGEILDIDGADLLRFLGPELSVAQRLRTELSAIMRGCNKVKSEQAAKWIVSDWGGISRGSESIPSWIDTLRPFDTDSILSFIRRIETDRISSWSKILAFIDHEQYAIFDSRTSLALNSAMVMANLSPRFYVPPRKTSKSDAALHVIKIRTNALTAGFEEYLFLLNRFVELKLVDSVLNAERMIFAGADCTANKMLLDIASVN